MKIELEDVGTIFHEGVAITIERRVINGKPMDYGYRTGSGLSGIGYETVKRAEEVAKEAIDLQIARGDG